MALPVVGAVVPLRAMHTVRGASPVADPDARRLNRDGDVHSTKRVMRRHGGTIAL
ncbi:MAG: hypothetical protein HOI95_16785 [Chromatiales bacterium]|jgi:hypothetical protein|nr:hypothetical protein [Chromatiales bacterium]